MAFIPVTLEVGETTTPEIGVDEHEVITGFVIDANLTGTSLSFTAAATHGGTFVAVEDDASTAVSITVGTSSISMLTTSSKIAAISPLKHVKIVSGSTQATADSVITVLTQRVC